jgi:hypothetical protein
MLRKMDVWLPCTSFFAVGRIPSGFLALVMQISLILWPLATRWARGIGDQSNIERVLAELAETHRVPTDPYPMPQKRFRQVV